MVEAKRQGYAIERALVQANIDTFETMGGNKDRRLRGTRPESIRSLYEQVANLDCMLTSLETQIDVLSSVNHNLPKEFHDTFHDSGTSGHEPDSLEAIQTVVSGDMVEGGRLRPPSPPDGDAEQGGDGGGGGGDGGGGRPSESAVLLHLERCAHRQTRRCLQEMKERYEALQQQLNERAIKVDHTVRSVGSALESLHIEHESTLNSLESLNSVNSNDRLVDELKLREMTISQLRTRVLQLEKDRLDKVPLDAAKEINRLNNNMIQLEKQRDELTLHNFTLKSQLSEVANKIHDPAATFQVNKDPSLVFRENGSLQNGKGKDADDPDVVKVLRKATYKVTGDTAKLKQMCSEFDAKEEEYKKRIGELETELKNLQNESNKNHDRTVREMENRMELASQKLEAAERYMAGKEEECNMLKLDIDTLNEENKRLKENLNEMMLKQQNYEEVLTEKKTLGDQYSRMVEEHRVLSEDFNRERVLRKKYYNQVEEMKGKIRVYCRVRPLSDSERRRGSEGGSDLVVGAEDEFSVSLNTTRGGHRSFLFDRVFQPLEDQQAVFQDTHALVQSALDGFNVTIMAYGQTGSGKTYTMLGTESEPGIAPRAFSRLFHLLDEGRARQEVSVSTYMLELYNDKLIDLLKPATLGGETDRLDIKRDKKGIVHVQGATLRNVSSANELSKAFNDGLANRHTAATKMNVESSRSHLLIAVCLTITSKQTGSVLRGKLTLVDLAGSERVSKSGASSDQLKEANSINKSLSALGDVISALSSESSFVPYRNSKLTMLLQDSLGGNAKTLVFVNVSPAAYNADETLVSLMYATRIKQITNSVCKNADNKEIMRLKSIINKLRKGEDIEEEVVI